MNDVATTNYHHISYGFKSALKKTNMTNFRYNVLRHTFASHFIINCGDLMTLKEILGSSTLRMVEKYPQLTADHNRKQIKI